MGVSESVNPDDDPLLQASLALSTAVMRLMGVNESIKNASGSEEDIQDIQLLCFDAGVSLAESLGLKISTKLHRLMYHVSDQFYSFGCFRRGGTDENEAQHKDTKDGMPCNEPKATRSIFAVTKCTPNCLRRRRVLSC